MKKLLLGLVAAFAFTAVAPMVARAEDEKPAEAKKEKKAKKSKKEKAEKPAEGGEAK